jgi:hypothetical protein
MPGASGGVDSTQLKEHQQPGKQEVLAQQQMQRIEEIRGPQQPLAQQQQLLYYRQQLGENRRLQNEFKQRYDQQALQLRSMELSLHGQQLRHDQQQKLMEQKTLRQQLFNNLQSVVKQQEELWHGFVMLGGISEQQQLLKYAQYLFEKVRKLKLVYEQGLKRFRSMELTSGVQQLGSGQQQLLQRQKAVCQQFWNDWQVALKRQQEFQHKLSMLTGEGGLQISYGHQQKEILQGQEWVPVGHSHYQQSYGQQGVQLLDQSGKWLPIGPAQPHYRQHDLLIQQPPQHILHGAENSRWSGADQQQERKLASLNSQQKPVLDKQQKEIEEEKIRLEQQKTSQQQQNVEQLSKPEEWTMLQMPQDQGGHDQQPRDEQQRRHGQQQRMEQLRDLQEKLKLKMQQQQHQQQGEEGDQRTNHDQRKQNEQEILYQQIRSLEQQILQQQREDDHRDQQNQQLQQSGELQQQPPHHQAEDSQQLSNNQKWPYEKEDQGTIEQQGQRQMKSESQQPSDGQYLLSYNNIEDVQNIRGLRQMWERISQEQDKLQQIQRYRHKLKQQQRKEELASSPGHSHVFQNDKDSQQEGRGDHSDGVVLCVCGASFNPDARFCANPSCGRPHPRNQPQGPPCVHCGVPLITEGALKCGSCYKKQTETPTKPAEGSGGIGIPPLPPLGLEGYGYSNPPQPGGVQLSSAIVIGPTTPYTTPVFGEVATIPSFVLVHQPIQGHPGGKESLSAAGNKPLVMMQPNLQQPFSTYAPQGSPAAGISGALPPNQGNDGGENQAVVGPPPGVPGSAWSTKNCSPNGQHSAMEPSTQLYTTKALIPDHYVTSENYLKKGACGNNFSSASTNQKVFHVLTRARRAHTPRAMVHCECYCTDGFDPGEIRSIEHAQDSLVQACAVVSIGVSGIGVATMGNKKALFVTLVDHISRFEA